MTIHYPQQGHAAAMNRLGIACLEGAGGPRNAREGAGWLRKAAEQGHAPAQRNLGHCYELGLGVPRDPAAAAHWAQQAAADSPGE